MSESNTQRIRSLLVADKTHNARKEIQKISSHSKYINALRDASYVLDMYPHHVNIKAQGFAVLQSIHRILDVLGTNTSDSLVSRLLNIRRGILRELNHSNGTVRNHLQTWTGHAHVNVQEKRRHSFRRVQNKTQCLDYYLTHYFRKTHIRSPKVPEPFTHVDVLYRYVSRPFVDALLKNGVVSDNGFMAFARTLESVLNVYYEWGIENPNETPYVLRLRVKDVERGTPWLWFQGTDKYCCKDIYNGYECYAWQNEVLLPPGTMTVQNHNTKTKNIRIIDVKYQRSKDAHHILNTTMRIG